MNELDLKKLDIKPRQNSLISGLSDYLKNPSNYEEIQKIILNSFMTTCSHGSPAEMAICKICTEKMLERRRTLKKLGFKNPKQYYIWQKIHREIRRRYPLVNWGQLNAQRLSEELKNTNEYK